MKTITLYKSDFTTDNQKEIWDTMLEAIEIKDIDNYQNNNSTIELMIHSGTVDN